MGTCLEKRIDELLSRARKRVPAAKDAIVIEPTPWSKDEERNQMAFGPAEGQDAPINNKNRNATWLGKYYQHLMEALYGGKVIEDRRKGTVVTYPDLVIPHANKILESKGSNEKSESLLKCKQLLTYARLQHLEPETGLLYVNFRHAYTGSLTTFDGTEEEFYRDLAQTPCYAVEFPVTLLLALYETMPKGTRIANWGEQARKRLKEQGKTAEPLLALSKGFFNRLIRTGHEAFAAEEHALPWEPTDPDRWGIEFAVTGGIQYGKIAIDDIPLVRVTDRDPDLSRAYLVERQALFAEDIRAESSTQAAVMREQMTLPF